MKHVARLIFLGVLVLTSSCASDEDEVLRVAVAANFKGVAEVAARLFGERHGVRVDVSSGSTGLLFTQIRSGAPHDVFLAADEKRPRDLVASGAGTAESLMCYARGRLVLAAAADRVLPKKLAGLQQRAPFTLAVANPDLAPFGHAAREALGGSFQTLEEKGVRVVRGENAAQAWHFLAAGAVDYAFVPRSMAQGSDFSYDEIPTDAYQPIRQFAVVVAASRKKELAGDFLRYLRSDDMKGRIREAGYDLDDE